MPSTKTYFRDADEAQAAGQVEFYRSGIYHDGRLGGPECPTDYRGDGRDYWSPIPAKQIAPGPLD